jgi:hypothetical protein
MCQSVIGGHKRLGLYQDLIKVILGFKGPLVEEIHLISIGPSLWPGSARSND